MKIFEYPYMIITILAMIFLLMGLIGLYFTIKSVRIAKETSEQGFCSVGKIENAFEKAGISRQNRCIVYISISLDSMKRLCSDVKAVKM